VAKGNGRPRAEQRDRTGNRIVPFTWISFGPPSFVPLFGNDPFPGPLIPPFILSVEVYPNSECPASSRGYSKKSAHFFRGRSLRHRFCADGKAAYQSIPASIGDLSTLSGPVSATPSSLEPRDKVECRSVRFLYHSTQSRSFFSCSPFGLFVSYRAPPTNKPTG